MVFKTLPLPVFDRQSLSKSFQKAHVGKTKTKNKNQKPPVCDMQQEGTNLVFFFHYSIFKV